MKFLIAGFGSIGRRHYRNLKALGENDIVLLRSHKSTLDDEEIAGVPIETSIEAALTYQPDALIVATPTALHLDSAIPAAKVGCSILMEKPVSNDLNRIQELASALKIHRKELLVGFQFRYHPGLRKVKEWIEEEKIGRPLMARSHWGEYLPNWHPWEDYRESYAARKDLGGGVVRTLSHPFDYLCWLFGGVQSVGSKIENLSDLELNGVEDMGEISLQFKSGIFATVQVNYFQQPPQHTLEVFGTEGTIRWDNEDGAASVWTVAKNVWERFEMTPGFDRNDLFMAEMQHFINLTKGLEPSQCNLRDGLAVQNLVSKILSH